MSYNETYNIYLQTIIDDHISCRKWYFILRACYCSKQVGLYINFIFIMSLFILQIKDSDELISNIRSNGWLKDNNRTDTDTI